jgi:hypothetical protein
MWWKIRQILIKEIRQIVSMTLWRGKIRQIQNYGVDRPDGINSG